MLTLKINTRRNWMLRDAKTDTFHPLKAYLNFADGQKQNRTLWWFVSLMVHGNLILALPAALIYYYNAPIYILPITILGFFANLVANMGGMSIRVTLTSFFTSLVVNLAMLLIYVL
ncbi:hypothetical protein [Mucilaginibacter sp.]|uniref:hypothetical protein n=1 Tax=Mucilaginibacter sp. TaxID=1882438 RepID=UPI0035BBF960